jgi:hypothetical protein
MGQATDLKKISKLIQAEKRAAGGIFEADDFERRMTEAVRRAPPRKPVRIRFRQDPIPVGIAGFFLGVVILGVIFFTLLPTAEQKGRREITRLIAESTADLGIPAPGAATEGVNRQDQIARLELSWFLRRAHYRIHRRTLDMQELRGIFTRPLLSPQIPLPATTEPESVVVGEELNIEQRIRNLMASGQIERFLNRLSET